MLGIEHLKKVQRFLPGFHRLSSSVTMSTPDNKFSQNSVTFEHSGKRPDKPLSTISVIVTYRCTHTKTFAKLIPR